MTSSWHTGHYKRVVAEALVTLWAMDCHDIVMADGHYRVARTTRHRPVSDDTHGRIRHGFGAPHHVDIHSINICHMC